MYAVYGAMLYMLNPSIPSYVTIHNRIFSVRSEETENSNLENEKEKRTEKMFKCLQNGQGSRKFCGIFHATFHHFNCHGISIKDLINFATSIIFFAALSSISFLWHLLGSCSFCVERNINRVLTFAGCCVVSIDDRKRLSNRSLSVHQISTGSTFAPEYLSVQ